MSKARFNYNECYSLQIASCSLVIFVGVEVVIVFLEILHEIRLVSGLHLWQLVSKDKRQKRSNFYTRILYEIIP